MKHTLDAIPRGVNTAEERKEQVPMPGVPQQVVGVGGWEAGEIFNQALHGRPKQWLQAPKWRLLDIARWGHGNFELSSFGGGEGTEMRIVGKAETEDRAPLALCSQEAQVDAVVASLMATERCLTGNGC